MDMALLSWLRSLSLFQYTALKCGHRMPRFGRLSNDYCLDCIEEMKIQCAWCNGPISIGEPITLYTPGTGDFQIPLHAVVFNKSPLQLVGCLRMDCAETGADRAGFWVPGEAGRGKVHRVPTAIEAILGANVPCAVIVNDTYDMDEAMHPTLIPLEGQEEQKAQ